MHAFPNVFVTSLILQAQRLANALKTKHVKLKNFDTWLRYRRKLNADGFQVKRYINRTVREFYHVFCQHFPPCYGF